MKLEKGVTTHEEMILDLIESVKELTAKVEVIERDVEVLKSIAHGNALFSGGFGDWDPKVGLSLLIQYKDELNDEIEVLEKRVKELEEIADRYDAVMGSLNCDFEDMFPDWGQG